MKKYAIIADSTSSLDKETRKSYNIDYARMTVEYDGKERFASLDWDLFSPKEYYDVMRAGQRIYTGQVKASEFLQVFKKHLDLGEDILYIACSSALSGSYLTSISLKEQLQKEYPERKIIAIDALNSSMGQGLMCIKAAEMRKDGKSLEETSDYILNNRLKVQQFGTVESLSYLSRAGRVKASKAFFGNVFGVKPILFSNEKGENVAWKKAMGRKNSILLIAQCVKDYIIDPENQYVYVTHGDSLEDANLLKEAIEEAVPNIKGVKISYLDPIVGASTGPGTLIAYCVGKEVNYINE